MVERDAPGVERDCDASGGAGSEVEPALLEIHHERPLPAALRAPVEGLDGFLVARIVGDRAAIALLGAVALSHAVVRPRLGDESRSALGAPQLRGQSAPRPRRFRVLGLQLERARSALDRFAAVRVELERLVVLRQRLGRIVDAMEPHAADLGVERRGLVGAHRGRRLDLGELERQQPLGAAFVEPAELAHGGPEGRLELDDLAIAGEGVIGLETALLEHLPEAEQEASALTRVLGERRGGEPLPVEGDELVPLAAEEVVLLEGGEGDAVAGIGVEPFSVSIERRGHASPSGRTHP